MGAGVATSRGVTSAITLVSAIRTATAPPTHFFFPCLKHGAVSVMCGKLGIEQGKNIRECSGALTEAVVRRAAITTMAAILYTRLAAGVLSEKWCPQGQVCIEYVVCDSADNLVVFVIKGPEAIVNSKEVPAGVGMSDISYSVRSSRGATVVALRYGS